jgi:hypothetical protein
MPLLIKATPCIHSHCCAAHVGSVQFHCSSEPCFAMLLHFHAFLGLAFANLLNFFALPLLRGSKPHFAIASPFIEKLCLC